MSVLFLLENKIANYYGQNEVSHSWNNCCFNFTTLFCGVLFLTSKALTERNMAIFQGTLQIKTTINIGYSKFLWHLKGGNKYVMLWQLFGATVFYCLDEQKLLAIFGKNLIS